MGTITEINKANKEPVLQIIDTIREMVVNGEVESVVIVATGKKLLGTPRLADAHLTDHTIELVGAIEVAKKELLDGYGLYDIDETES